MSCDTDNCMDTSEMGAFFGRDPVLRGQNLATRESGIGPDFGQSPYLLHTFPPNTH